MKLNEIQDLIKFIAKTGVTEVEIEQKDFKINIKSEMPKGRRRASEDIAVKTIHVPQEPTEQIFCPTIILVEATQLVESFKLFLARQGNDLAVLDAPVLLEYHLIRIAG